MEMPRNTIFPVSRDLKTANWIGFFLEEIVGNGIWGRIIPITGIIDRNAGPAPQGLNPLAIRLIQ